MKFAIITHVSHIQEQKIFFAYAPYVREMNVWGKYVDEFIIVAPIIRTERTVIDIPYKIEKINFFEIEAISLLGLKAVIHTVFKSPKIGWQIYKAMSEAHHIHLRCPGNIGLFGCLIQILFPYKPKTAKYAGNWDPKSKQPWSYRLQKWILSNTFLTKNMQVLVYGEWAGSSSNVKPFFTATYIEGEKVPLLPLDLDSSIRFVFVGSLVKGKNPMYAIQLVEKLLKKRNSIFLDIYGEGILLQSLERYVNANNLSSKVIFHGNQNRDTIKESYQHSHFVILPSQSEGWPKAIAEGMFWGCVPLATSVSCVPFMLDLGNRGILLKMDLDRDLEFLERHINNYTSFESKRNAAADWSRQYTLDRFDAEIKKLLQ